MESPYARGILLSSLTALAFQELPPAIRGTIDGVRITSMCREVDFGSAWVEVDATLTNLRERPVRGAWDPWVWKLYAADNERNAPQERWIWNLEVEEDRMGDPKPRQLRLGESVSVRLRVNIPVSDPGNSSDGGDLTIGRS